MKTKSILAMLSILLALTAITVTAAHEGEHDEMKHGAYTYLVGTDNLPHHPVISMAENGDTLEITGMGNIHVKSPHHKDHKHMADGGGTAIHRNAAGEIIGMGEWEATELISFKPYGSGSEQGLPEEFEGGLAKVKVILKPEGLNQEFEGVMEIDCVLGNKVPKRASEGIRLNILGVINFDKSVHGDTLFVRHML